MYCMRAHVILIHMNREKKKSHELPQRLIILFSTSMFDNYSLGKKKTTTKNRSIYTEKKHYKYLLRF